MAPGPAKPGCNHTNHTNPVMPFSDDPGDVWKTICEAADYALRRFPNMPEEAARHLGRYMFHEWPKDYVGLDTFKTVEQKKTQAVWYLLNLNKQCSVGYQVNTFYKRAQFITLTLDKVTVDDLPTFCNILQHEAKHPEA